MLVYVVSYNTGKILIIIFTFGNYSSAGIISKRVKISKEENSLPITNAEKNNKYISAAYTCFIGFFFWLVSVTIFVFIIIK